MAHYNVKVLQQQILENNTTQDCENNWFTIT